MSEEVEICEDSSEFIELSDSEAEEDSKYGLLTDVTEQIIENNEQDCILIEDEQEVLLEHEHTHTVVIQESGTKKKEDGSKNKVSVQSSNLGCSTSANKKIFKNKTNATKNISISNVTQQQLRKNIRILKTSGTLKVNKTSQTTNCNCVLNKTKPQAVKKTSAIVKIETTNTAINKEEKKPFQIHNDEFNNIEPSEIHISRINDQLTSRTVTPNEIPRAHSNIDDFSKLKWLKPLRNLSTPPKLQIVIVDRNNPHWRIDKDNWLMIEKRLLEALNAEMLRVKDVSIGLFDGAKWQRGIKIVGCHNQNAFNFITKFILGLNNLWDSAQLDVFPITDINRHVVRGYIPPPTLNTDVMLSLIKLQNPTIHTDDWKVVKQEKSVNKNGVDLWITISDESFKHLCRINGEIKFGINRVFFKPTTI